MNYRVCGVCDYYSAVIRMYLVDLDNSVNRTGQPMVVCGDCCKELDDTRVRPLQGRWAYRSMTGWLS